ncbi:antibiotic biosynthesis monooxygenase [Runella rosea]|uniref:Antibiotic biosynthesis monooxygenase n=1 Tax=Runella rosea TaxID=2259595 RepID=A0A344TQH2_9BACT|nr:antibiotic biosynthesis monooxygenase family protein [Runella rosea]AXE20893.1 antibiotic biosynthesis monooxygenase [Runella rosea]
MLIRIVRMTFQPEKVDDFLDIFDRSKHKIRAMPGCRHLELLSDYDHPNVFITNSHWDDATALNNYRNSELFKDTWAKTKVLFSEKPLAFSSRKIGTV